MYVHIHVHSVKVPSVSAAMKKNCKAASIKVHMDRDGFDRQTSEFWIRKFIKDGGDNDVRPPVHPAMSPYWFLHDVMFTPEDAVPLKLVDYSFDSSLPFVKVTNKSESGEIFKRAAVAVKMVVQISCYTNDVKIAKGSSICLGEEPEDIDDE